ncbi:hypothetical protein KBTX_03710 [wastewater metagenome]|uniref:Uncharacterized protein n=2 Tax=unclassified sequences TaxID=12908 RepID=A0A5B8RER6_9ZZZZ|nr:hypothetical protein [Arhodomonas sp. KWT]QEA07360.1 hypothetical protein KBTEX_03710 [uncultured organism]
MTRRDVTTAHQSRVPIFAATRRPRRVAAEEVTTPWGRAVVTGRIGQGHRDLLEAAMYVAARAGVDGEGRVRITLDPYRLRRTMGAGTRDVNYALILRLARDLRAAEVDLHVPARDIHIIGGIIDEIVTAGDPIARRAGTRGGDGETWRITYSRAWSVLLATDLPIAYSALSAVIAMRHGATQAVARWALSHRHVRGEYIADVLLHLAPGSSPARRRRQVAEVLADADALADAGVAIDADGRVWV